MAEEQRVLKFRVWGGFFSMGGSPECENEMYGPYDIEELAEEEPPDRVHIMQFTGLLDKNGEEIYEGDILGPFKWHPGPTLRNMVVRWDVYKWRLFMPGDPGEIDRSIATMRDAVVLGNIHENPELMAEADPDA